MFSFPVECLAEEWTGEETKYAKEDKESLPKKKKKKKKNKKGESKDEL